MSGVNRNQLKTVMNVSHTRPIRINALATQGVTNYLFQKNHSEEVRDWKWVQWGKTSLNGWVFYCTAAFRKLPQNTPARLQFSVFLFNFLSSTSNYSFFKPFTYI